MEQLWKLVLFILVLTAVLHSSSGGKKGSGSKTPSSKKPSDKPSQTTKTQPSSPRQPSNPGAGSKPGYPSQHDPGRGGSNPGGYPKQNPGAGSYPAGGSYPAAGGNTNQYPGRGGVNPGGYPNQNPGAGSYPAGGSYPSAGGNPNQYPGKGGVNPGGYPNQNPGAGSYPPGGSYPSAGGNPNQYPGRGGSNPGGYPNQNPGGYPNQNPGAGAYPAGGSYPSAGGNPSQYPGRGGVYPGGYPYQNPGAGTYPAGGNTNQYPGRGGYNPGGIPAAGSYPMRPTGQPGVYPGGHPSIGGSYPNWNPNNKILSPRYGGTFGGGSFGGSPFSQTVKSMGYHPSEKSKGYAKKAMVAAGVGAVAGMAVGYGIGKFQRPNVQFSSPQEERHYNQYMYQRQGTRSKDERKEGRPKYSSDPSSNTSKQPLQAQSYDQFMNTCMKRKDLLKDEETSRNIQSGEPLSDYPGLNKDYLGKSGPEKNNTTSPTPVPDRTTAGIHNDEDNDTVSIMQIGYPALIEQMKARKCVERYMVYIENVPTSSINHNGHHISGVLLWLTTSIVLFSST